MIPIYLSLKMDALIITSITIDKHKIIFFIRAFFF